MPVSAGEGLWPYNQFPKDSVKQKLGFEADAGFLDHLRLASVKMAGGSGSFVSPAGLLLTTRQVAAECLSGLSSAQHDYFRDGYQAGAQGAELPCAGMDASILVKIEDVTEAVKAAGTTLAQRNAAIARIEKECGSKGSNACNVVRLFSGGRYDLYQYRRYSDLRLVFAPEYAIAFFGRERDSISYLRYGLNIAFLRAYENGKPAATADYLKWSQEGVKEGDLVFLGGNPGPTGRLSTASQLTFLRDTALPLRLARLQPRVQQLNAFAAASVENLRAAQATLGRMLTEYKTDAGQLIGLRDDRLVTRKTAFEGKIRRAVEGNAKLGAEAGKVWDEITNAYKKWKPLDKPYEVLEAAPAPGSRLFRMARQLVRGEAMDDSGDAVNETMESMMLAQYLTELGGLGMSEKELPLKAVVGGAAPAAAAEKMVKASQLKEAAGRKALVANREAALKSGDPVLALAQAIDGAALRLRKQHEEIIGALEVSSTEKIAQFRLKLFGAADYPDGTGTPRVEFGTVKGYTDRAAVAQPYAATFSGLYYRKDNEGPWLVPQRWLDARPQLNPVTPLNFVSTADIGGGDYGSATVNQKGELVGVTFDGNLESLPVTYLYSDEQARAVHVDVRGIVEALERVYRANDLLKELGATAARGGSVGMATREEIVRVLAEGVSARRAGRLGEAGERMNAAAGMCGADQGFERALVLRELGELARDRGDLRMAQAHYEQAVDLLRTGEDRLKLAHTIRHLGDVHRQRQQRDEAERCYTEALDIYRGQASPGRLDLANAIGSYARLKTETGPREEARALWIEAGGMYEAEGIAAGVEECRRRVEALA